MDELHDEEQPVAVRVDADVVDGGDAGQFRLGGGADLPQEPFAVIGGGRQQLPGLTCAGGHGRPRRR